MSATISLPDLALDEREASIHLPDGRTLSYALLGALEGPAVFVLDGPGSRGLARVAAAAAAALGTRLIAPDRPGFFGSTPVAKVSYGAVAADLVALADTLGLEDFGVLGQSAGTPFALALAAAGPDRVRGLALCGAVSPLGERGAMQDVAGPMRMPFRLARRAPFLVGPLFKAAARQVLRDPAKAARRFAADAPPGDARALARPELWAIHERTTAEAIREPAPFALEARRLARPWDVDLERIAAPVAFWVGDRDVTHPPVMSRRMAQRLGDAPVHVVPDAATFGLVECMSNVIAFAARV
jgi:pimeloyl-ACP methyl ester carboxylesterase